MESKPTGLWPLALVALLVLVVWWSGPTDSPPSPEPAPSKPDPVKPQPTKPRRP